MEEIKRVVARVRDDDVGDAPAWAPHFLCGMIVSGGLRQALDEAGVDFDTA